MATDKYSPQAWFKAVQSGNQDDVLVYLKQGRDANIKDEKQNTALHHAVKQADLGMVSMLIAQSADLDAANDWQSTPLHLTEKNIDLIRLLLEAGANPNLKDKDWDYPYYFAFYGSMTSELTKLYIKYGAHLKFVEK